MKVNPAQQVRLWFMAGLALLGICLALTGITNNVFGLVSSGFLTWEFFILVAECALGCVSFYRFVHPLPPNQVSEQSQPQPEQTGDHHGSYQ
jgi:uncharacterized paraquat-inducible protein A